MQKWNRNMVNLRSKCRLCRSSETCLRNNTVLGRIKTGFVGCPIAVDLVVGTAMGNAAFNKDALFKKAIKRLENVRESYSYVSLI